MTPLKERLARKVTALLRSTGTMGVVRHLLAGQGIIFMLHEVQDDPAAQLSPACPVDALDWTLGWLRREGWEIISLGEVGRRLRRGDRAARRFAAFTFDDGYRDTLTHALPVMEKHGAAFTLYVPTHAVSRELYSWWLGLRELFRNNEAVSLSSRGRQYKCGTMAEKFSALRDVIKWVEQDYNRAPTLSEDFRMYCVHLTDINEKFFLSETEIQRIARHQLVTIGGHTVSHAPLACLDAPSAQREINDNRRFLQQLVDQPVDHFAYPYGNASACTLRDAGLAALAGYSTAVTTRYGIIHGRGINTLFLPRTEPPDEIEACALDGRASGVFSALATAARPFGLAGRY